MHADSDSPLGLVTRRRGGGAEVAPEGDAHVKAARRVLQYLYRTKSLGITYYRESDQQRNVPMVFEQTKHPLDDGTNKTQVFADSDYAADESRRFTMGGIIIQNGGPISWSVCWEKLLLYPLVKQKLMQQRGSKRCHTHWKINT